MERTKVVKAKLDRGKYPRNKIDPTKVYQDENRSCGKGHNLFYLSNNKCAECARSAQREYKLIRSPSDKPLVNMKKERHTIHLLNKVLRCHWAAITI